MPKSLSQWRTTEYVGGDSARAPLTPDLTLCTRQAAVEDLERLRDSSPEEANIVFQLARVYRLLGDETKAAQMLAIVRDMSPKSLNKIKRLLETTKKSTAEDGMEEG